MKTAEGTCPAEILDAALRQAITVAKGMYGEIEPCAGKTWGESVSEYAGIRYLWFNTSDNSTRMVEL